MTIRIVTDSTCDLPGEIVAQHGITVVPYFVNLGSESYLDGVDISRQEFYARLPDCDTLPTTAMPNPHMLLKAYEKLAGEGATQILSIHISKSLSSVTDSAHLAAREASVPVTVFDSGTLSLGTGFMVWEAAQAAAGGRSVPDILASIGEQGQRTHVFAALDTLEFIQRSGRVSRLVTTVGTLLQMKPLLKMHAGNPTAERIRTSEAAIKRLIALLEEQLQLERAALVHTHALDRAEDLRRRVQHLLPQGETLSADITPVFGTHLGPGAVGLVTVRA